MNEKKVSHLKNYYSISRLNLSFINFLFLIDVLHFQETGRRVTNLHFLFSKGALVVLNSPPTEETFSPLIFTRRELRIIKEVSEKDSLNLPPLTEGEVNFFSFLNEYTVSPEVARAALAEEEESRQFSRYFTDIP